MAEAYFDNKLKDASVNVQRRQKTFEAFSRLPEEFTNEDVMRCFALKSESTARTRVSRLVADNLIEKCGDYVENGTTKSRFRKTGVMML
jgi:predicted HTH transcriptional regulator